MSGRSLAMVYSPCQEFEGLYEGEAALMAGTIFRELEKPFYGARRLK
ncbi:MAG: spore coat associated protein CotJA [Ruminococcaceae bacterium]|nr:spore coat associated protein CotJA [Oscillospiraceae bacterium]